MPGDGKTAKTGDLNGDSADFSQNGDVNGGKRRDQGFGRRVTMWVMVRVTVMTGASGLRGSGQVGQGVERAVIIFVGPSK